MVSLLVINWLCVADLFLKVANPSLLEHITAASATGTYVCTYIHTRACTHTQVCHVINYNCSKLGQHFENRQVCNIQHGPVYCFRVLVCISADKPSQIHTHSISTRNSVCLSLVHQPTYIPTYVRTTVLLNLP